MSDKIPVEERCIKYQTMFCNPDACCEYRSCRALKMLKIIVNIVTMNTIIDCDRDF